MSEIVNTTKNENYPEWCLGGSPSSIEAQEARGQSQFVNSTKVPSEIVGREELEKLGFKFGEPDDSDPLFCDAELPKGYSERATDHSMWSEIIDSEGNVRATIFYKAAFYDRRATLYHQKQA